MVFYSSIIALVSDTNIILHNLVSRIFRKITRLAILSRRNQRESQKAIIKGLTVMFQICTCIIEDKILAIFIFITGIDGNAVEYRRK